MSMFKVGDTEFSPEDVIIQAKKTSGWLGAITLFSLINLMLMLFNSELSFVVGLGITQIFSGLAFIAKQEGNPTMGTIIFIISLMINISAIGIFFLLWFLAKRGSKVAYIIGSVLYFIDGLLLLLLLDWIGVVFHAFFLFMLCCGYQFQKRRKAAEQMIIHNDGIIDIEAIYIDDGENLEAEDGI